MRFKHFCLAVTLVCAMAMASPSLRAETTVTLSDVHLCCNGCVRQAGTAVEAVPGAKAVGDREKLTVTITAPDAPTAQKAVDALVAAGYFGKSSDPAVKPSAPSGAVEGKVQTLDVSGVHLCCGQCVRVVKEVLGKVEGVTGNTVAVKATTFTVTGDFNAKAVFAALNDEGMSGRVAKPAAAAPPTTAPAGK